VALPVARRRSRRRRRRRRGGGGREREFVRNYWMKQRRKGRECRTLGP